MRLSEGKVGPMAWFTSILVEPLYRMIYGAPLAEASAEATTGSDGAGGRRGGLVLVADGVGGLDLCGTALRYVLGAEGLPYAIRVFPWGHGFGRWLADLTDVSNRDLKAAMLADAVRRFRTWRLE